MRRIIRTGAPVVRREILDRTVKVKEIIFLAAAAMCLIPFLAPPIALGMGLLIAWFLGHPYPHLNGKATGFLIQFSVVSLGFGMNVTKAVQAGREGFLFTIISITGTLLLGLLAGRVFKVERKTAYLISMGTAVCGGSAIAAISPVIRAEEKQISIAIGTVYILNSVALFLFPFIGNMLHLSQTQFGFWAAIAIHDTSSVVGAGSRYGADALEIATTVKLMRALWIIPLALLSVFVFKTRGAGIKVPWFIGIFVLAMILNTYLPFVQRYGHYLAGRAKPALTLSLFLIGAGLPVKGMKAIGWRPFLQGVTLWVIVSAAALVAVSVLC